MTSIVTNQYGKTFASAAHVSEIPIKTVVSVCKDNSFNLSTLIPEIESLSSRDLELAINLWDNYLSVTDFNMNLVSLMNFSNEHLEVLVRKFPNITSLSISNCPKITDLRSLDGLGIKTLSLSDLPFRSRIAEVMYWESMDPAWQYDECKDYAAEMLEHSISRARIEERALKVPSTPILPNDLPSLEHCKLHFLPNVTEIEFLVRSPLLKTLDLTDLPNLTSLPSSLPQGVICSVNSCESLSLNLDSLWRTGNISASFGCKI